VRLKHDALRSSVGGAGSLRDATIGLEPTRRVKLAALRAAISMRAWGQDVKSELAEVRHSVTELMRARRKPRQPN
jgi:hypothetical protein